ncbi:MAG: metal-sulfur cluster assembly factor [Chloroflexi bacterium]|nr:metal-sulfur cluster assembly factor [Chloroflexota bacterium]
MAASLVTEDWILEALRQVFDPELGVNVVDLGLVYGVAIDDGRVAITMTLTTPGCPLHASLSLAVEEAVRASVPGVEDVRVNLVWDPPWTPERLTGAAKRDLGWA